MYLKGQFTTYFVEVLTLDMKGTSSICFIASVSGQHQNVGPLCRLFSTSLNGYPRIKDKVLSLILG